MRIIGDFRIDEVRFTIYDLQYTKYDLGMYQFENVPIRVSKSTRSPLQIEDSTIPKNQ